MAQQADGTIYIDTLIGTTGLKAGGKEVEAAVKRMVNKVSEKGFLDEVKAKGDHFRKKLTEIPEVEGVDGMGLMIGIRLKTKKAADVCRECLGMGLLTLTAKTKLRLLPPLNITYDEIDKGIEIIRRALQ